MVKYPCFEAWFDEREIYSFRSDRFFEQIATKGTDSATLRKWLEAAFYSARLSDQTSWTLTIEEDEHGAFLTLPEDLLAHTGWKPGTKLNWSDNGDGSWTLKEIE